MISTDRSVTAGGGDDLPREANVGRGRVPKGFTKGAIETGEPITDRGIRAYRHEPSSTFTLFEPRSVATMSTWPSRFRSAAATESGPPP
jgi:hypothetical protein